MASEKEVVASGAPSVARGDSRTGDVTRALSAGAMHGPGRHEQLGDLAEHARAERRIAIERSAGALTGAYLASDREQLRADWPA
jgi:hypothetical protein